MKRATLIVAAAVHVAGCDGGEQQELKSELAGLTKDLRGKVSPLRS
jgi:hypothetical protein